MVFVSETVATFVHSAASQVAPHVSAASLAIAFAVGLVGWLVAAEEADLRRERDLRG